MDKQKRILQVSDLAVYLQHDVQFRAKNYNNADENFILIGIHQGMATGIDNFGTDETYHFELYDIKPLLLPPSSFTLDMFADICRKAFGWKESYQDIINGYWAVCEKEDQDEEIIGSREHWEDKDWIAEQEEIDFDRVISITPYKPNVQSFDFDIAYGTGEEMRFFPTVSTVEAIKSFAYAIHLDIRCLIPAGLALNKLDFESDGSEQ